MCYSWNAFVSRYEIYDDWKEEDYKKNVLFLQNLHYKIVSFLDCKYLNI